MAFCTNCGAQIDEGKNFCPKCGTKAGGAPKVTRPKPNRTVLFATAVAVIVAAAVVVALRGQGGDGLFAFISGPTETSPEYFETEILDHDDAVREGLPDGGVIITGYTGTAKEVVIPKKINGLPVVAIGFNAFTGKELTGVTIPNSVTFIERGAFGGNQLTSVIIPNSVTTIEAMAFAENKLTSVTIPNSVTTIGRYAFALNQLTSVTIPNSITDLADNAFDDNVEMIRQ